MQNLHYQAAERGQGVISFGGGVGGRKPGPASDIEKMASCWAALERGFTMLKADAILQTGGSEASTQVHNEPAHDVVMLLAANADPNAEDRLDG